MKPNSRPLRLARPRRGARLFWAACATIDAGRAIRAPGGSEIRSRLVPQRRDAAVRCTFFSVLFLAVDPQKSHRGQGRGLRLFPRSRATAGHGITPFAHVGPSSAPPCFSQSTTAAHPPGPDDARAWRAIVTPSGHPVEVPPSSGLGPCLPLRPWTRPLAMMPGNVTSARSCC